MNKSSLSLQEDFEKLRDAKFGKQKIKSLLSKQEQENTEDYLAAWYSLSKEQTHVYPSQGLLLTPHDYLDYESLMVLPQEKIIKTLRLRRFFLEMFNHPYRVGFLKEVTDSKFKKLPKIESGIFESTRRDGMSISIGDLGASVVGSDRPRSSRTQRYAHGPFVKLGKYARVPFVGSASPDVWNSAAAISTMAASHCLSAIPRNGVLSDVKRQADLAEEVFAWLSEMDNTMLKARADRNLIYKHWKANVVGTLEPNPNKALVRAEKLYRAGVRSFRVYSPEPGTDAVTTTKLLRKNLGSRVEIFTGHLVDVDQAKAAEQAGADGITIGIGGGGRCITGVRSGSVIDWPSLLWDLRGEISIPVIVEGGASDNVSTTLLLGASGIGVTRVVGGGTIESPGGALFCTDKKGKLFKPYGGEASARTKYLDGKLLPFDVPAFVEGETTKAYMSFVKHALPTLTYNLHMLIEDAILAMVFRNVDDIASLQALDPSPLKRSSVSDAFQRGTH